MHRFQTALLSATLALVVGFAAGCPDPARAPAQAAPAASAKGAQAKDAGGSLTAAVNAKLGVTPDTVVGSLNGKKITLADVDEDAGGQLAQTEHDFVDQIQQLRQKALEHYIDKTLLLAEAKKRGLKDENELIKKVVEEGTAEPSDADVQKFYDENKARMGGAPLAAMKPRILKYLGMKAKQKKFEDLLGGLKSKAKVTMDLPELRTKVAAVGPAKGPKDAPVTIVEFSDFQCPYCKRVLPTVDHILSTYGDKVHFVWRNFPLPFHQHAEKAAEAGACADAQGQFWAYHDKLYANQDKLDVDGLKKMASEVKGIDAAKFDKCLDGGAMKDKIQSEIAAGKAAGVSGTPAFFINGVSISGAQPFEKFQSIIDKELARGSGGSAAKAD